MGVASFDGCGEAVGENFFGFGRAGFANKKLSVHKVGGNVIGAAFKQSAEMGVGSGRIAGVHALHGESIAGESVVGLFGDELFEQLAAGFLLVGH